MAEEPEAHDRWAVPQQVLDMPGASARNAMLDTIRLMRIVARNGAEVLSFLERANEPEAIMKVWNVDERDDAFEDFLNETERLLFNFLAAVAARVDSYRYLVNRGFFTGDLLSAYNDRVRRGFRDNPLHHWLIGLRNYMLHHRLPVSHGHLKFTTATASTTVTVTIQVKSLLTSSAFNSMGKRYMDGKEAIDVAATVVAYISALRAFDDWLIPTYWSHHKADIDAFHDAWKASALDARRRNLGF